MDWSCRRFLVNSGNVKLKRKGEPDRRRIIDLRIPVIMGLTVAMTLTAHPAGKTAATEELQASASKGGKEHWAFRVPMKPETPPSGNAGRARSAIDRFVWARLNTEGLSPSPPADRYTLLRRASLDLTGLPPSIEEVDDFVSDSAPNAYAKVVDRLLASPHYGERWALWWLDLARYADSNGYESDRTRSIWPYRDWVIGAFNNDMPFEQFIVEQIAGDMLPGATASQRIATGFHRNTWINEEGGHDWEQFRYESVVDRVHTTATVFLGLTMACAQCHDHKHDPVSQREYWQLFDFFNNADEPDFWVPDPEVRKRQMEIDAEIIRRVAERGRKFPPLGPEMSWMVVQPTAAHAEEGATLAIGKDGGITVSGENPATNTYTIVAETPLANIESFRLEVLPSGEKDEVPIGRADDGNYVISELRIRVAPLQDGKESADFESHWSTLTLVSAKEDCPSFAQGFHIVGDAIDSNPKSGWAGDRASTDLTTRRDVSFAASMPTGFKNGTRVEFRIEQNFGRSLTMRRFRLSVGVPKLSGELLKLTGDESRKYHLDTKFDAWLENPPKRAINWNSMDPITAVSEGNATMTELKDGSILVMGDRPEVDTYEIVYGTDANRVTGILLEALPDERLPNYGPGRGSYNGDGAFVVTEFRVELHPAPAPTNKTGGLGSETGNDGRDGTPKRIEFTHAYATYQAKGHEINNAIDGNKLTSWFIGGGAGKRHVAVFETVRPYEIEVGTRLRVTILQNYVHQQALGRFRLLVTGDDAPLHSDLRPAAIDALMLKDADSRTNAEQRILRDYYLSVAPELRSYNDEIQKLRDSRPRLPTTLVFKERRAKDRRSTHIHIRGEYQRPGEKVWAAVPAVLHSFPKDAPRDRLTFAKWLVDDRNPLVGRVIANQLWQSFFGRGLVSTPENFGVQGSPPSHPKLLDWLAIEFRRGGRSFKSINRQIVMSEIYRQSSKVLPEIAKRDPQNILLARGPRVRVVAETIRDIGLKASGLIVGTLGGPSVFPPQPIDTGTTFGPFRWRDSMGSDRYRRGLYTFRKRGGPYASFATFDAPPPNTCTMSRHLSNTPLQALTQLNDLVVIEASRALARRVFHEGPKDVAGRIRHAFRLSLARPPTGMELGWLIDFYEIQRLRLEEGSLDSTVIYGSQVDNLNMAKMRDLAAMTTVARLLLNLDETITKE